MLIIAAILGVLVLSNLIQALDVTVFTNKIEYVSGENIVITVDVEIDPDEIVPLTNSDITIFGIDPANSGYISSCQLNDLTEGNHPECSGQDIKFQSVTIVYQNVGHGYGNRSVEFEMDDYEWGYGYGYQTHSDTILRIIINWKLPEDWESGNYTTEAKIKSEKDLFNNYPEFSGTADFKTRKVHGKIAFLCTDNDFCDHTIPICEAGLEPHIINWLEQNGWEVTGKVYDEWTDSELDNYQLIVCSDELKACKAEQGSVVYNEHKEQGKPFVEIGDYRYVSAAWRFGYIKNYMGFYGYDQLFVTGSDPVTADYSESVQVVNNAKKMTVIPDYNLKSQAIDLGDSGNKSRSTLFKVDKLDDQGRYAYVGWFNTNNFTNIAEDGEIILIRLLNWAQCGNVNQCNITMPIDTVPPIMFNGQPVGIVNVNNPSLSMETNEDAICKGSIDIDKNYDDMDFEFSGMSTYHEYNVSSPVLNGVHTVYVKCKDFSANIVDTSYFWSFEIQAPFVEKIAYLCRDDYCDYGIEDELIDWLEHGWDVDAKAYDEWTNSELDNYQLIVCSDELIACKAEPGSVVYNEHKEQGRPFVEIGDYRYVSAAWRFGYIKNYMGYLSGEQLYIASADQIVQPYSGLVTVLPSNLRMCVVPDYNFEPQTVNLANSGNNQKSSLFKVDESGDQGRYVYVGWFMKHEPIDLTVDGEDILARVINWGICGNADGC